MWSSVFIQSSFVSLTWEYIRCLNFPKILFSPYLCGYAVHLLTRLSSFISVYIPIWDFSLFLLIYCHLLIMWNINMVPNIRAVQEVYSGDVFLPGSCLFHPVPQPSPTGNQSHYSLLYSPCTWFCTH